MSLMHPAVRRAAALAACALAAALAPAAAQAAPKCTASQGQALIDGGQYQQAVQEFTCVVDADPIGVEGYRGRIEAESCSAATRTRCATTSA